MQIDDSNWTYNEFLAFLLVYAAGLNTPLTDEELDFIKTRTGISNIEKINTRVKSISDAEAMDIVEDYRQMYLDTTEKKEKVRHDLEDLLKTGDESNQLTSAVVHILERFI